MTFLRQSKLVVVAIALGLGGSSFAVAQDEEYPPQPPRRIFPQEASPQDDASLEARPLQTPAGERQPSPSPPLDVEALDIDEETKRVLEKILPIEAISTNIAPPEGAVPPDRSSVIFVDESDSYARRSWPIMQFHWEASEIVFQPPYWEHTPLERYGQTISPKLQPVLSGLHFFGTFPIIPYKMGIDAPFDRISTLGYYQPGSPTPCLRQRLPWEWDAALMEAGFWAGGIAIFP